MRLDPTAPALPSPLPAYRFTAIDPQGRQESGLIQADSPRLARQSLRDRGLVALEVIAVETRERATGNARLGSAALALMLGQLASILRAGVPIDRALQASVETGRSRVEKDLLAALRSDVLAGFPLSEAMRRQPRAFDASCVAVVRAGERSGLIDQVLERLAVFLERRHAIAQKIRLALIYPALLVGVSVLIIGALLHFVIPQVATVFAHNKQALPLITQALLGASAFVKSAGLPLVAALVAASLGLRQLLRHRPAARARAEHWLLGAPVIGSILREGDLARTTSTVALLAGAGVPLVTALVSATEVGTFKATRDAFTATRTAVEEGAPLARALQDTGYFPPLLVLLAGSGEEAGRLPQMLGEAAARIADGVELRVNTLVRLFEPAVVLAMGLMVLFVVLSVLLPIFEMNQLVR